MFWMDIPHNGQTRLAKLSSQAANLHGARLLMKPLLLVCRTRELMLLPCSKHNQTSPNCLRSYNMNKPKLGVALWSPPPTQLTLPHPTPSIQLNSQHLEMDKIIPVLSRLVAPHGYCFHRFLLHVPLKGMTLPACSYVQQTCAEVYNYR